MLTPSQFDVCGAATSTALSIAGKSPHTFHPEKYSLGGQEFLGPIAERAGGALCNHSEATNPDGHHVSELISDLGHLCDREGHSRSLIRTGLQQWEPER